MPRGQNKRSLANLRPAQPGEVRNPSGINTKRPLTDEYWKVSGELVPETLCRRFNRIVGAKLLTPGVSTWARAIALRASYEAALCGILRGARELREAMEGKAPQRLEISAAPTVVQRTIVVRFENRRLPAQGEYHAETAADATKEKPPN